MNQQLESKIIDSNWTKFSDFFTRKISLQIDRIETEKEIIQREIKTDIQVCEKYETTQFGFDEYFQIWYCTAWVKNWYYDIDRTKSNKYQFSTNNQIFNCLSVKVNFTKETKTKIKAKIKRILEKTIKEDQQYFSEKYQTTERPTEINYSKRAEEIENLLESV